MTGQVYTQKDVENYFSRISVNPVASYFKPMSSRRIIQFLLEEYSKCFDNETNWHKKEELKRIAEALIIRA
jgi:hypothetical protein